jgi:hypothetical protein
VLAAGGVAVARYLPTLLDEAGLSSAGGPPDPGPTSRPGSAAPSTPVVPDDPTTPEDRLTAVMSGTRRTLIHIAEVDRDLALDLNFSEVAAGDGTGAKSEFALVPVGVDYQIRSLRDPTGRQQTCLGVKVDPDDWSQMVPTDCVTTKANLFGLSRTGKRDEKNRPTYWIHNSSHGFVQWSVREKVLYVQQVGDAEPLSSFSFVDRGPLPTPTPSPGG